MPVANSISNIIEHKNNEKIKKMGGARAILKELKQIMKKKNPNEIEKLYGTNKIPFPPRKSFFQIFLTTLRDKTLLVLIFSSLISVLISLLQKSKDFYEGLIILSTVFAVGLINSFNTFRQESSFIKSKKKQPHAKAKIVENGNKRVIDSTDIRIGDIYLIERGDVCVADCLIIDSHQLQCDESEITGETQTVRKQSCTCTADCQCDPFLLSGVKVINGMGTLLVLSIGKKSFQGRNSISAYKTRNKSILQANLEKLTEKIAFAGTLAGFVFFVSLLLKDLVRNNITPKNIATIFFQSISLVVISVPEGLPMAITISLSLSIQKMQEIGLLVRETTACETMGRVTTLCCDKTGTLTENKLTVEYFVIGNTTIKFNQRTKSINEVEQTGCIKYQKGMFHVISKITTNLLLSSIFYNTTAIATANPSTGKKTFYGSKTECALLELTEDLDLKEQENVSVVEWKPFSSTSKWMGVLLKIEKKGNVFFRLFCKGQTQKILYSSNSVLFENGTVSVMTKEWMDALTERKKILTKKAFRSISTAYQDYKEQPKDLFKSTETPPSSLVFVSILFLNDPIRKDITQSVKRCQDAGVGVRVVTGDDIQTAEAVAKQAGILTDGLSVDGSYLKKEISKEMLLKIQVVSRATPADKVRFVLLLKEIGEVVAVTGDGTNDAQALKCADVGLGMESGTEIAKEASSIIILNDKLETIIEAISWGRRISTNVKNFIQFQLTVNLTAVCLVLVTALADKNSINTLTIPQMLWINLVMDTLAALSLSSNEPNKDSIKKQSINREDSFITKEIKRNIFLMSSFHFTLLICLFFFRNKKDFFVFNTFVYLELFNEINCKFYSDDSLGLCEVFRNSLFCFLFLSTAFFQAFFVYVSGSLSFFQFSGSVLFSLLTIPAGWLIKTSQRKKQAKKYFV